MKIIVQGTNPDVKPIRLQCMHCKTVAEAERKECRYNSDQRDGDFWSAPCPVCHRQMTGSVR